MSEQFESLLQELAFAKGPDGNYLLPEVRETCPQCEGTMIRNAALTSNFDGRPCKVCYGLGLVPVQNMEIWVKVLTEMGYKVEFSKGHCLIIPSSGPISYHKGKDPSPKTALLLALEKAMEVKE